MTYLFNDSSVAPPVTPPAQAASFTRERRVAESLQRVLLGTDPRQPLPGLSVETFYEAALDEAAVGGDSCDAFPLSGDRVALCVADASGKGLAAAERIAEVRFALRAFLREHADPCRAIACLNDFICASQQLTRNDFGTFVTLTLAVLDATTGETECLCAGGEPPLLLRSCGAVRLVPALGGALGLYPGLSYTTVRRRLGPGDAILLVTDGITEARHFYPCSAPGYGGSSFLGIAGLSRLARRAGQRAGQRSPLSLRHRAGRIFEGARAFAGGSFHDDACLLAAQREPLWGPVFLRNAFPSESER